MNPTDDSDSRSIAIEAVITAVLRRFYCLGQTTRVLFDQALEDAAQSVERLASSKPNWRGELNEALAVIDEIQREMKKPLNTTAD